MEEQVWTLVEKGLAGNASMEDMRMLKQLLARNTALLADVTDFLENYVDPDPQIQPNEKQRLLLLLRQGELPVKNRIQITNTTSHLLTIKSNNMMIQHSFKTILRHLWRNRFFATLNVLGLAIGISASWVIYRMVDYEYSHDKKIPDAERIHQVVSMSKSRDGEADGFAGVSKPVVNVLLNDAPGVELVVPMFYQYYNSISIPDGTRNEPITFDRQTVQVTTLPSYFDMIEYRWLAGSKTSALDAPDKVVLTEKKAREYFPDLSPEQMLGKTIIYDDTLYRHVSGVVANLDYPNSFNQDNTEFMRIAEADFSNDMWGGKSSNDLVFVKAAQNANPDHIIEQVNVLNRKFNKEMFERYNFESWYELMPLSEKHFAKANFAAQTLPQTRKYYTGSWPWADSC